MSNKYKLIIMISILLNALIGGLSINAIGGWIGINIPFIGDMIIGTLSSTISVPIAIIGWILRLFGVFKLGW